MRSITFFSWEKVKGSISGGYGRVFVFIERVGTESLVARNNGEITLNPSHVLYSMDMLAEQKCFDLGGACNVIK